MIALDSPYKKEGEEVKTVMLEAERTKGRICPRLF